MSSPVRTSRRGLQLIKSFEGFRPGAARLADGRWTIGYGHVRSARQGVRISERDAEHLLRYDLQSIEAAISEWTLTPLNQNEFDALASLVFNISPGQFRDSELLRRLNAGDHIAAAHAFDAWRRARVNGRLLVVDALVRRRTTEKALFLEPIRHRPAAPTPIITPEIDVSVVVTSSKATPVEVSTDLSSERAEAVADVPDPFQDERALEQAVAGLAAADAQRDGPSPATDPQAAAALVSARISKLLSGDPDAGSTEPLDAPGDNSPPAANAALTRSEPAESVVDADDGTADEPRILIDDTEVYDPGLAVALENSIGRDDAEDADADGDAAVAGGVLPWGVIVLGALILMALGGGDMVQILREGAPERGAPPGPMIFITGALAFVMGLYFWISRRPSFLR